MEYILFSYWRSSASYRVRIILAYKNLPYTVNTINLLQGNQKSEEHISRNPMCQIPCFVSPDISLTQSLAIIQFLEDKHPEPSVFPKDPVMKAKAMEIFEIINSGIQPLQNIAILQRVEEFGGNKSEWAIEFITKGLHAVEKVMKNYSREFAVGDQLSLADAALLPQVYNAKRFNIDLEQFPTLKRVSEHLLSMSQISGAHPEAQPDAVN